ncbi:MAG: SRPBCC domain-containing protein [Chloroflexota bacterium]
MSGHAPVDAIQLAIDVPVDAPAAWAAITDPARIIEWFTDASALGPAGSPYRLDFGDGSVVEGTVLTVEPGYRFSHTWSWAGADPDETTTVTWSVEPLGDGRSRILLVHGDWDEARLDAAARDEHESYWTGYLEDLVAVLGAG